MPDYVKFKLNLIWLGFMRPSKSVVKYIFKYTKGALQTLQNVTTLSIIEFYFCNEDVFQLTGITSF